MRRLIVALMIPVLMAVPVVYADDGGGYFAPAQAEPCGSDSYAYSAGKTEEGFSASATDGCHTVNWTGSTTDSPGSGTVTFQTVGNVNPWDSKYALPGPENGNYCQYRAVHEANGWFTNRWKAAPGTEVTVEYSCT